MLKFRLGGDDILFPPVGKAQVAAELPHELLRTALLEHTLAIGRVADDDAAVARQALTGGVRLAELDVFAYPGLLCVRNGDGKAAGVDVRAENAVFPAELRRARGLAGLRPDILRNAGPALRRKFAGKSRRAVQRGQRRFDDDGAGAAERVPEEIAAAIAGQIHHGGGHGLVQRSLVAHGAVAALVQADTGAVEEDLAQVLHDGKAQLVGLAGLGQPRQAVVRAEMIDRGFFDDGLAARSAAENQGCSP